MERKLGPIGPICKKKMTRFVAHCESYAQNVETIVLMIRVSCVVFERLKNCTIALCIFP